VRHELARRAGYDLPQGAAPGSIDMRDAKILRTAERLFLDRGGSPIALLSLKREKRYGDALFDRLVEMEQPSADTAASLAEARAEVIRAALAQRGVPPARVQVEPPVAVDDTQEGVPTELSLRASG
jgi:hypothetical protein